MRLDWGLFGACAALLFTLCVFSIGLFMDRCKHEYVRCIHGDEIISTLRAGRKPSMARARCLACGKALYKLPLPEICYITQQPHPSFVKDNK